MRYQSAFCDAFEVHECIARQVQSSASAFENWCRKSCTFNIMIASCTIWIAQDYPLQCKPCFHIKAHLNTCFDHICCEFTNWRACGDQYMVSIIKCLCVYAITCTYFNSFRCIGRTCNNCIAPAWTSRFLFLSLFFSFASFIRTVQK